MVGWPPIRSFRKNLASSSSSKPTPESPDGSSEKAAKLETSTKGLFVKINMDGIPIGRKVDLKAFDSYDKLSVAVDALFSGLLAGISIVLIQSRMLMVNKNAKNNALRNSLYYVMKLNEISALYNSQK